MGRCQSTPGLVESRGRIPLEEMWISPVDVRGSLAYSISHSILSASASPMASRLTTTNSRNPDSPMSAASSRSSEDPTTRAPQSAATQLSTGRQSTHSGKLYSLFLHFCSIFIFHFFFFPFFSHFIRTFYVRSLTFFALNKCLFFE